MTAAALKALHVPGKPLILPNVWDVASAKVVELAGFPAVASSSAAIAESLGYPDHHGMPVDESFGALARITGAVSVPVTVDVEGGYGLAETELGARLADVGAVGCNLEDTDYEGGGYIETTKQAGRIADLKAANPDLVVNARVDVFIKAQDQRAVLDDAIARGRAYLQAGADCVFPIFIRDPALLKEFIEAVPQAAVNAMYIQGGPDFAALAQLGVARISLAAGLWWHIQSYLRDTVAKVAAGQRPY